MYRAAGLEDTMVRRIARGPDKLVAHFSAGPLESECPRVSLDYR